MNLPWRKSAPLRFGQTSEPLQPVASEDAFLAQTSEPPQPARSEDPSFAPDEPTDGRSVGEWRSRYSGWKCRTQIGLESFYVFTTICTCLYLMLAVALGWLALPMEESDLALVGPFVLAYVGGHFGGSLFTTKWLYHTVARGIWNADRVLWRVFTPFLSGGAALALVLLSAGGVIPLLGEEIRSNSAGCLGVGIVIGYFSDKAFSALGRFAERHFGEEKNEK